MRRVRVRGGVFAAWAVLVAFSGCNALIGNDDVTLRTTDAAVDSAVDANVTPDAPAGNVDANTAEDASRRDADASGDASLGADADGSAGCTDTTSDSANCGTCGHSCQGGTCSSGLCQPIQIVDTTHGLAVLNHIAVDSATAATNLYGTNAGASSPNGRVWKTSTTPNTGFAYLAGFDPAPSGNQVGGFALEGSRAMFGIQGGPSAGTWTTTDLTTVNSASQIAGYYNVTLFAVDPAGGPYTYTSDGFNWGFAREPKNGIPAPPTCACFFAAPDGNSYPPPVDLLTDANSNVFWAMTPDRTSRLTNGARLISMATSAQVAGWTSGLNCASKTLATTAGGAAVEPRALAVDATHLYWSNLTGNKIYRVNISGSPVVTDITTTVTLPIGVSSPAQFSAHLIVDATWLYWITGHQNIYAIKKDGTSTSARQIVSTGVFITAIAQDNTFLYFTDSGTTGGGTVWKVAK
jgi:hypothetical protein